MNQETISHNNALSNAPLAANENIAAKQTGTFAKHDIVAGVLVFFTLSTVFALIATKPDFAGFGGRILLLALALFTSALLAKLVLKQKGDLISLVLLTIGSIILGVSFFGISGPAVIVLFFAILARPFLKVSRAMTLGATFIVALSLFIGRTLSSHLGAIEGGIANSFDGALLLCGGIAASLLLPGAILQAETQANNFSQIKKAKAETIAAKETIDERTRFIAEMSHEIRTPLNAILGFSDTMREGIFGELSPQYKEYAELIHQSGTHLVDLVGDILDMSKIDAGRYVLDNKPINIGKIAAESAAIYGGAAKKQGVEIEVLVKTKSPIVADERSMRQILLNLLSNAIKFTPNGGKIIVHTFENADNVWLEVSDNGRGMSEQELVRISAPYMSSNDAPPGARGTGLGLALVRRLTAMQNGRFDINSKLGAGTVVSLEFKRPN